jgi:hypothetical protein
VVDLPPGGIEMADKLKEEIQNIPFPDTTKRARSFCGSTVYYSKFIPNYSTLMAPIMKLAMDKFDWKDREAVRAGEVAFGEYKRVLENAMTLAHPDFSLPWTLRTDASTYGIGAVLFQTRTEVDAQTGEETQLHQPLFFLSSKFSDAATRWSTREQECYAIYYALKQLEWYLLFKPFVIETDHNNLRWLEQSTVAKLVRWRLYIQQFHTMVKHERRHTTSVYIYTHVLLLLSRVILYSAIHLSPTVESDILVLVSLLNILILSSKTTLFRILLLGYVGLVV